MIGNLLIDECLSPELTGVAIAAGFHAASVQHLGLAGTPDWALMQRLLPGDFIFVTNNAIDFIKLFSRTELHNGLILILPNVSRVYQRQLFRVVLKHLSKLPDLINTCLTIDANGTITVIELHA